MKIDTKRLEVARMEAGMTIDDVSRRARRSYWSTYQTFKGRSAAPAVVRAICRVLRIRVREIVEAA